MGSSMYAAVIPPMIHPIIEPTDQRNILKSPSRVWATLKALRKLNKANASEASESGVIRSASVRSNVPMR